MFTTRRVSLAKSIPPAPDQPCSVEVFVLFVAAATLSALLTTAALLDRMLHHAHIVPMQGESYRSGTSASPASCRCRARARVALIVQGVRWTNHTIKSLEVRP